jgi:predicted acyltransferase
MANESQPTTITVSLDESPSSTPRQRLRSLDQFRGYTIAGMFLVNFLGSFYAAPYLFGHHLVFCSYADTIMPQFFFAVGLSMRLSWSRRTQIEGISKTYLHALGRSLALATIAILWYGGTPFLPQGVVFEWESFKTIGVWGAIWKQLKVDWFQTLMHIAVASIWVLPVIRASAGRRIGYIVFSILLHAVLNYWFYFAWHNSPPFRGIDGGPLGFLTWSVPLLVGTLAYDWIADYQRGAITASGACARMIGWGIALCLMGWGMSCGTRWYDAPSEVDRESAPLPILASDPVAPSTERLSPWWNALVSRDWERSLAESPFVPPPHARDPSEKKKGRPFVDNSSRYRDWNYWMMSQQVGSPSYLLFSSGTSLAVYLVFFLLADLRGWEIGLFRTLGVNALIGYFLHSVVEGTVKSMMPRDINPLGMWIGFAIFFLLCWTMLRSLEKKKIFLKL